ncbi:MAG TPA: TraR/DksA C4-type zinc finger protein [Anaeromyxobacteraceae bacterium]|nr:TraR/DksA C4-type zinc finger protein [Anaeromyxobacteraceae bacterium]
MRPEELRSLRERLESRRRQLIELSRHAETGIEQIRGEREIEFGDEAQSEEATRRLESLEETERGELARIQAALERMEAGQYGICRSCREPIEPKRLAALPLALECAECAGAGQSPIRP